MDVAPPRDLKISQIVEEMLDVIERNAVAALAYVLVLALANGAVAYFGLNYTSMVQQLGKGVIGFLVGVGAAFLLTVAMLRKGGLLQRDADESILSYALLAILTSLGVLVGFILIIFPGFYFMARWSIAQPLLLTRGMGAVEAMKASWERTKGSEFSIIVIVVVLVVVQVGAGFLIGTSLGADNLLGIGVNQAVSSVTSVVGIVMAVALYRLIAGADTAAMVKTFA